ncbi:hypothetical protein GSI_02691 [Ganoderma sinense ZZ0214-1]|uniref:Uncharacterized protein n=1 Tax=Ganoderma sinense ZZ0214-1 TaxID=1077348 RepID=A0A2G8SMA3_9APHY|nr:hypothetical protein GSI_02691 [Ganoderma sinense ZZ0214-1]
MSEPYRRVWFMTGTSTGVERAVTEVALEKGVEIVVATALTNSDRLLVLPLDVGTQPDQITAAFAEAERAFGRIDAATEDAVARAGFETNFWGAIRITREAIRCFRETNPPGAGGRRLLQMSSYAGLVRVPGASFYGASMFALEGASESLAAGLGPAWNVKVAIIEPGWIRTELTNNAAWSPEHPAYQNPNLAVTHVRRFGWDKATPWKDATRMAEAIYKMACAPDPPLHFLLGKDAIEMTRKKIAGLVADIDAYEPVSEGLEE